MFNVSNNQIITITRGDTASTTLSINLGTTLAPIPYSLEQNDKVYFAVMEPKHAFEQAIIKKVYTVEDFDEEYQVLNISFKSEDTEFLLPGTYYYMIKLFRPKNPTDINSIDKIDTIVTKHKFIILD